jgi:hypothetical protein
MTSHPGYGSFTATAKLKIVVSYATAGVRGQSVAAAEVSTPTADCGHLS